MTPGGSKSLRCWSLLLRIRPHIHSVFAKIARMSAQNASVIAGFHVGEPDMARPSLFTAKRRELIIVALAAGASRRTASEIARIHHSTLGLWLKRGERSSPGSRFAVFRGDVLAAEQARHHLKLLPLVETPARDVMDAWRYLERHEFAPDQPNRFITVRVSHSDGTPVS